MSLILAFNPDDDFYVDDERFVVTSVLSPTSFVIRRERDGAEFRVRDDGVGQEISPGVFA